MDRLDTVAEAGATAIDRSIPWLSVSLIPALLGARRMSREYVTDRQNLAQQCANERLVIVRSRVGMMVDARPGRRRAEITSDPHSPKSMNFHADCYLDGTGFAAHQLDTKAPEDGSFEPEQRIIEQHLVNLLDLLVRHATTSGAGGDAAVQAQFWPASDPPAALRVKGPGSMGSRPPTSPTPAELTVPLTEVAGDGPQLIAAAAGLAIDILAEYGVDELDLITLDGQINQYAAYPNAVHAVRDWATARGIPTT